VSTDDGESGTGWERGEEDGATVEAGLVCIGREQGRRVFGDGFVFQGSGGLEKMIGNGV